jgi:hypothetical protein
MSGSGVTQINADYLNKLKNELMTLDDQVQTQLNGIGPSTDPGTTNYIHPLNDISLTAGPQGFNAGLAIKNAVHNAGGSVYNQLEWLDKVLKDMIDEITNAVNSLHGTESLNNEAVDKLMTQFQNTSSDMNGSPNSSTSNPNTSSGNPNTSSN